MRIAIAAASILALAAAAAADTIKVPQDQPTIQAGVGAAASGDTVSVAKGVYFENVVVATPGITIVGKGAILDGNIAGVNGDCLTINAVDVVLQGMSFRHGDDQVVINAAGAQILKCTFQGASNRGILGTVGGSVITSSKFLYNGDEAIDIVGNLVTVSKCTITRSGNGVILTGDGNRVESCTFVGVADGNAAFIDGANAVLLKNKATYVDGDSFSVEGDGAVVDGNKADRCDGRVASVTGNGALIQKNTAGYTRGGILADGDGAQVLSNKVSNCAATAAIDVAGDGFTITGNTVSVTFDEADGIQADFATAASGGLIEGNKVSDTGGIGFDLESVNSVVIRKNTATRCGTEGRGGFRVTGDNNTLDGLTVTDPDGTGILVTGNGNDAVSCTVKKAGKDGFRNAVPSTGNTFDKCSATSCGGEGFDNRGIDTILTNSTFSKNRIDLANDAVNDASFAGTLDTVTFTTGGASTPPEVD